MTRQDSTKQIISKHSKGPTSINCAALMSSSKYFYSKDELSQQAFLFFTSPSSCLVTCVDANAALAIVCLEKIKKKKVVAGSGVSELAT